MSELSHISGPRSNESLQSWREQAPCRGMDTKLFFPKGMGRSAYKRVVIDVCAACPFKGECLADAAETEAVLRRGDVFGYRAGMTATQRADYYRDSGLTAQARRARSAGRKTHTEYMREYRARRKEGAA